MNMLSTPNQHARIARPEGLPGYEPREWCAVCGKSTANKGKVNCSYSDCPNICHPQCLGEDSHFTCTEVQRLRQAIGIPDEVSHVTPDNETTETHESSAIDEERELLQLEPTDLVRIIRNLRSELARKNSLLKFLGTTTEDIASKRDAVVNILNFFDSIVASTTALPSLEVRSIACTARPEKIDAHFLSQQQEQSSSDPSGPQQSNSTQALSSSACEVQSGSATSNSATRTSVNAGNQQNRPNNRQSQSQQIRHPHRSNTPFNRGAVPQGGRRPLSCRICKSRGHSEASCNRRKSCDFCNRRGHTVQECRTKRNQERQENFLQNFASEQAHNNALIVQTLQSLSTGPHHHRPSAFGGWPLTTTRPPHHPQLSPHGPWFNVPLQQRVGQSYHPLSQC